MPERKFGGSKPSTDLSRIEALIQSNPREAKRLVQQLRKKVLRPHSEGQREVLTAEERFLILCAGRRWGKTKVGAAKALRVARRPDKRIAWVAPLYKNVKYGYKEVLSQIPDGLLTKTPPSDAAFDAGRAVTLQFASGSTMTFYSADRPEGLLGQSLDFVVLDEAAMMPRNVWEQVIRPTLADRAGQALFISTPRGRNWYYRLWQRGQDPLDPEYRSWRFPSHSNPYIPDEEWDQMKAELPEFTYNQEVLADFVSNASSVFRNIDNAVVGQLARPYGPCFLGCDLAKQHDFTVLTAARGGDRMPVFHDRFREVSWPEQRRRISEAVRWLEEHGASSVTVGIDATGIGDVVYDDLSFEGLDTIPVKFTQQWKQQAVMLLAADLERGNAHILPEQLPEFESYAYKISETTGRYKFEAGAGHDDEVSAKLIEHWILVNEGSPDVQMLTTGGFDAGHDEAEVEDGAVVREPLSAGAKPRSPVEMMNDPAVWG